MITILLAYCVFVLLVCASPATKQKGPERDKRTRISYERHLKKKKKAMVVGAYCVVFQKNGIPIGTKLRMC